MQATLVIREVFFVNLPGSVLVCYHLFGTFDDGLSETGALYQICGLETATGLACGK